MKTLDEIMVERQTDKASFFNRTYAKPHDYCRHYEMLFSAFRREPIKFLEIGVGGGESIQGWLEYFTQACVFGVDLVKNTNPWNDTLSSAPIDRYRFTSGNQGDVAFWALFIAEHGTDWNIIVDDGSHVMSDITTTFNTLWPNVVSGGMYAIEDLSADHLGWIHALIATINGGGSDIDSITFSKELAILTKRG